MAEALFTTPKVDFTKPLNFSILKGQTALITGGASGMGLGVGIALAAAGAFVVLADMDLLRGEAAATELTAQGYHVRFVSTDVVSYESQLTAFKAAIEFSPKSTIDIVLPFAGIEPTSIVTDAMPPGLSPESDPPPPNTKVLDVNLTGTYYTTHLAIHYFKKMQAAREAVAGAPRPQILFMSSMAGYLEQHLMSNYATSKWGVRGLFKSVRGCAEELGNMRSNLLAPYFIRTPLIAMYTEELAGRGIKLGEVSDAVDGAMRCLCDETVDGRAIIIAAGEMNGGAPGSANFDVCDDLADHDAAKELLKHAELGVFGDGFFDEFRFSKKSREKAGN